MHGEVEARSPTTCLIQTSSCLLHSSSTRMGIGSFERSKIPIGRDKCALLVRSTCTCRSKWPTTRTERGVRRHSIRESTRRVQAIHGRANSSRRTSMSSTPTTRSSLVARSRRSRRTTSRCTTRSIPGSCRRPSSYATSDAKYHSPLARPTGSSQLPYSPTSQDKCEIICKGWYPTSLGKTCGSTSRARSMHISKCSTIPTS